MNKLLDSFRGRSILSLTAIGLSALSCSCNLPAATGDPTVIPIYDEGLAAGAAAAVFG